MSETEGVDPLVGKTIGGKFRVLARIARGGMGAVYRAEQAPLGRPCALKVLKPKVDGDEKYEFARRFFLEASTAAKLSHPNTVTIFDYGKDDELGFFLAMELLEGRTLARAIREDGPFSAGRASHVARQIARSLREAHAMGVVHRDVKPANVYLVTHADEPDFVKVLDFGLVKDVEADAADELTQAGLFMGSPKYMSPEQIRGDRVDGRSDLYALGVVLFEMLAGKVPFDRGAGVNTLLAHMNDAPPLLRDVHPDTDATDALAAVVARCLAKRPDDRFSSMEELLAALRTAEGGDLAATVTGASATYAGSGSGPHVFVSRGESGASPSLRTSQIPTVSAAPPPRALTPPRRGWVFASAAVVVAAAAALGVALRPPQTASTASLDGGAATSAPAARPSEATPAVAVPVAIELQPLVVRVTSEPSGASVRLGEHDGREVCIATPCEITLRGAEAEPGTVHRFVLAKNGFAASTRTLTVGDTPAVAAKLKPTGGGHAVPSVPKDDPFQGWKPPPY